MSFSSKPPEEKFLDAAKSWNLEQLYVALTNVKQKPLSPTERTCLRGLLCGLGPKEIAVILHRQPQGLRVDLTRGLYRYIAAIADQPVKNWRDVAVFLERAGYRHPNQSDAVAAIAPHSDQEQSEVSLPKRQDWGNAPDLLAFFGRTQELQQLEQWVIHDRCRTIAIVGMSGIGKTNLSLKLAQGIQEQFQFVIWRSLLNAPPLLGLLADLIPFISAQQESLPPADVDGGIASLIHYLQTHRCLLILDNVETLLQEAEPLGGYRAGYEGYSQLFHQLGAVNHQSCVVLTSREKPGEIARLEGRSRPVRSLKLQGLDLENSKAIFTSIGDFSTSDGAWQQLIEFYNGNPLALELVAKHIKDTFDGNITDFLNDGTPLFHDLYNLLDWHFERLSEAEQEVMYWLSIAREAVTTAQLKDDILSSSNRTTTSATLQVLQHRFPLEKHGNGFTLQPVVIEYVTQRLVKQIYHELITVKLQYFNRYALVKAQAKGYIRESQIRVFIEPILSHLQAYFHTQTAIVCQLQTVLQYLRDHFRTLPGYGGGNLITLLRHLDVDLTSYDFSRLSIWQTDLTGTKLHRVNFQGADLTKSTFAETFGGISCVTFSPDGCYLATSDTSGEVQVWNVTTGQQQLGLKADAVWTWAVAFSPNGQTFATAGDDYQVKLWDSTTGDRLRVLEGHSNTISTIAFSPTDSLLASAGQDATIRLWMPDQGDCVGIMQGHQGRVWAIAFSPDGQTLISGSEDCTLKQWDVRTGSCVKTWSGHTQWIKSVAFSRDGKWVASGGFDGSIYLWEVATGRCLKRWQAHQSGVTSVTFRPAISGSQEDMMLASSSYDQMVKLWEIPTGNCWRAWQAHDNRIWSVAFSPDGLHIASGGEDHATRLWAMPNGQLTKTWKGHTNNVLSLSLSFSHTYLASAHEDQTIKLWKLDSPDTQRTLRGHQQRVWSVAFAPTQVPSSQSLLLASGSADRTIKLWDALTGECRSTLYGHKSWVWSIAFNPTGDRLASGSYDRTARLWNIETGECLQILSGHTNSIICVAFSPDGRYLATSSLDTTIKLWDVFTGACVQTLNGHQHSVWAIAFHPQGYQLASCSYDKTIKLWDISEGMCLHTFTGHDAPVVCLTFGYNGQQLVSGSYDRTIKVWDIASKNLLQTLYGHKKPVYSLLFKDIPELQDRMLQGTSDSPSSDAREWIISSSFDQTIRLWDAVSGQCLITWRASRPYENMNIADVTGLTEAQKETLYALGAIS